MCRPALRDRRLYSIKPQLNAGDFAGDGVDARERPSGEIRYGSRGVDRLRAAGLLDGQRVVAECFALLTRAGNFGLARAARPRRAISPREVKPS